MLMLNFKELISDIKKHKKSFAKKSPGSSTGRAKLWRCLGYKFKSYLGHAIYLFKIIHLNLDKNVISILFYAKNTIIIELNRKLGLKDD